MVALLWMIRPIERRAAPNPERLVYVEPAPPPPPPAAVSGAGPAEERAKPVEQPSRLVDQARPKPIPKPVPAPRPRRPPETTPSAAGAEGGEAGGVVGGTLGGKVGGTVGGHGDAPIAAELAASPPVVVSRVLPEYPLAARARGVEGRVLLRAVVDRDGRVEDDVVVVQSVPPLDEAAVAALRQWRFTPGRAQDGRTVRVVVEVPMRFQLH